MQEQKKKSRTEAIKILTKTGNEMQTKANYTYKAQTKKHCFMDNCMVRSFEKKEK